MDDVITEQLQRLRSLWPALNSKPQVIDEIRQAIVRQAAKLQPQDVVGGFDDCIAAMPTSGWPPGPHEVVGCVMRRSDARRSEAPAPVYPPRTELTDRYCSRCNGPVALIPHERVVYCSPCNLVQSLGYAAGRSRYHLEYHEIKALPIRSGDARGARVTGREALGKLRDAIAARRSARAGTAGTITIPETREDAIAWDDAG